MASRNPWLALLADAFICLVATGTSGLFSELEAGRTGPAAFSATANLAMVGLVCWNHCCLLPGPVLLGRSWTPGECARVITGAWVGIAAAGLGLLVATLGAVALGLAGLLAFGALHSYGMAQMQEAVFGISFPLAVLVCGGMSAVTALLMSWYGSWALPGRPAASLLPVLAGSVLLGAALLPCEMADGWFLGGHGILTVAAALPWSLVSLARRRRDQDGAADIHVPHEAA